MFPTKSGASNPPIPLADPHDRQGLGTCSAVQDVKFARRHLDIGYTLNHHIQAVYTKSLFPFQSCVTDLEILTTKATSSILPYTSGLDQGRLLGLTPALGSPNRALEWEGKGSPERESTSTRDGRVVSSAFARRKIVASRLSLG